MNGNPSKQHSPHQRLIIDVTRSVHILCVCILVGGLYFSPENTSLRYWMVGAVTSGLCLLVMEIYRNASMLAELRGIVLVIKMLLLLVMTQFTPSTQLYILMVLVLISAMISHSPRKIRHYSLLPDTWLK